MFMVVWSGTLERKGECPSLSSYSGPSMLTQVMTDDHKRTPMEAARWRKAAARYRAAKRVLQQLRFDI